MKGVEVGLPKYVNFHVANSKTMARIFLCHASEDKPKVREIYQRLQSEGFEPWLDEVEILTGQEWDLEIRRALRTSDFIMVLLSRHSANKTGYVQREFKMTMDRLEELPSGQVLMLPVRLDDGEIPDEFQKYHCTPLYEEGGLERVIHSVRAYLSRRVPLQSEERGQIHGMEVVDVPPEPLDLQSATPLQTFTNSIGMELILIPAGTFMMGTPGDQLDAIAGDDKNYRDWIENETPEQRVTISQPFLLGKFPVTQAQWQAVMGENPSRFQGENRPVERVSWEDAQAFMQKLNERETGRTYRLPTEAEWEYACRAGTTTRYHFGDDAAQLGGTRSQEGFVV